PIHCVICSHGTATTATYTLSLHDALPILQCYEGLDESKALYEWKYGKQLLYTQILREKVGSVIGEADDLRTALGKLHAFGDVFRSEEHTSELQSRENLVCRLLLEKKK